MFMWMITIVVLAVLYGLAWHNQPARSQERPRTTNGPDLSKLIVESSKTESNPNQ
jgi:hypothetical protein